MTPADFREFVFTIADKVGFARNALFSAAIIWGQTAGSKNADAAMERSVAGKGICSCWLQ
ncbi:hypothetical protein ACLB1R_05215 [Escherichia coli]